MWEFMDRWSNVSLKIRMTLPPYMNDRQYHVNGPCPTLLLDKWLLAKLIDVLLLPCCCFYPHTHFASYGRFAGPIDSNSVNCGLTIYHPSTPYGADCCVFVLNYMCCCVPSYSHILTKGWFVAYVHIDPIKADLVSYTKIHGQDKLILTQ